MAVNNADESFGDSSANPYEATRLSLFDMNMEKARAMNKVYKIIFRCFGSFFLRVENALMQRSYGYETHKLANQPLTYEILFAINYYRANFRPVGHNLFYGAQMSLAFRILLCLIAKYDFEKMCIQMAYCFFLLEAPYTSCHICCEDTSHCL